MPTGKRSRQGTSVTDLILKKQKPHRPKLVGFLTLKPLPRASGAVKRAAPTRPPGCVNLRIDKRNVAKNAKITSRVRLPINLRAWRRLDRDRQAEREQHCRLDGV